MKLIECAFQDVLLNLKNQSTKSIYVISCIRERGNKKIYVSACVCKKKYRRDKAETNKLLTYRV